MMRNARNSSDSHSIHFWSLFLVLFTIFLKKYIFWFLITKFKKDFMVFNLILQDRSKLKHSRKDPIWICSVFFQYILIEHVRYFPKSEQFQNVRLWCISMIDTFLYFCLVITKSCIGLSLLLVLCRNNPFSSIA